MMDPAPSDNDLLIDLLLEWEERAARGEVVSVADLCPDRPELAPALAEGIARLKRIAPLAEPESPDQSASVFQPPTEPLAGRYRLDEMKGAGGFGVVWRAYDLKLERRVAVKLPRPGLLRANPNGEDAFLTEARLAGRFAHWGIVRVLDVGRHQGITFIVSEFIDGDDLGRRMEGKPFPVREAVRIVERAARSLHHAHQEGLTHRDVKPSNILLGRDGRVFVTDFGIAALADAPGRGATGTFSYMAPERLAGDPGLDPRADVYSLGAVLYELLTGRPPFPAAPAGRSADGQSAEVAAPGTVNPAVPPEVEEVCLQCLATVPADRPPTAEVLADRLERWLTRPSELIGGGLVGRYWRRLGRGTGQPPDPASGPEGTAARTAGSCVGQRVVLKGLPTGLDLDQRRAVTFWLAGFDVPVTADTGMSIEVEAGHTRTRIHRFGVVPTGAAVEYFTRRMGQEPGNPGHYVRRAVSLRSVQELELAVEDCDWAIQLAPESAFALVVRGSIWQDLDYDRKALADFDQASRLDPAAPWPWAARASFWLEVNELGKSLADYSEAIRLDPTNPGLHIDRGRVRCRSNQPHEAQCDFSDALRYDPACAQAWIDRGRLLIHLGDVWAAINDLTEAIRLDPDNSEAYSLRAKAHLLRGKVNEATADFGQAVRGHRTGDVDWSLLLDMGGLATSPPIHTGTGIGCLPDPGLGETAGGLLMLSVMQALAGEFGDALRSLNKAMRLPDFPSDHREDTHKLRLLFQERSANDTGR